MAVAEASLRMEKALHLVITDSGLGGLSICAELERGFRRVNHYPAVRLTYFNAWPDEGVGYNDLPDVFARVQLFDRALSIMDRLRADRVIIACNTLSIVYGSTRHSRTTTTPVQGIVQAGVDLFHEALEEDPAASIVLLGTRTTIESGVHREGLISRGIAADRIEAVCCHGLARAIETDPGGRAVADLIEACTTRPSQSVRANAGNLYLGLCCTHYTYIGEEMRSALERYTGRKVTTLDPNHRLVTELLQAEGEGRPGVHAGPVTVTVVSKVALDNRKRRGMALRLQPVSAATSAALLSYTHVPTLF
jgi:glutamate racemase